MDKCVIDLFASVSQIDCRYFNAIGTRNNLTQYSQVIENSFTAELYHRFKSICEQAINSAYYNNLILHFDINKMGGDLRPDLVLHQAQENRENQLMFIEVKTDPNANLNNDFQKLEYAIRNLEFKNAVIVIVNRSFSATKQLVSEHFQHIDYDIRKKMFLINLEIQVDSTIEYNIFQFSSIRRIS